MLQLLIVTRFAAFIVSLFCMFCITDRGEYYTEVYNKFAKKHPQIKWQTYNAIFLLSVLTLLAFWQLLENFEAWMK